MVTKLLKLIPPHHTYVELFGGGASLLFAKKPSPVEVYNDLDSGLVNFFRTLRDPEKFEKLHLLASLTPWSREEYNFCRKTWKQCKDDVERAYRWYIAARMSFSGQFGAGWGFDVTESSRGMAEECSKWLSMIKGLPEIHNRLMRVQIEHNDFRKIVKTYDTPNTLFYCDPPYVPDTRKDGGYTHEMTIEDHEELIELLLQAKGMVILSGYRHLVHEPLEQAGWQRYDYETSCSAVGRTRATGILGKGAALKMQPRIETVWVNSHAVEVKSSGQLTLWAKCPQ